MPQQRVYTNKSMVSLKNVVGKKHMSSIDWNYGYQKEKYKTNIFRIEVGLCKINGHDELIIQFKDEESAKKLNETFKNSGLFRHFDVFGEVKSHYEHWITKHEIFPNAGKKVRTIIPKLLDIISENFTELPKFNVPGELMVFLDNDLKKLLPQYKGTNVNKRIDLTDKEVVLIKQDNYVEGVVSLKNSENINGYIWKKNGDKITLQIELKNLSLAEAFSKKLENKMPLLGDFYDQEALRYDIRPVNTFDGGHASSIKGPARINIDLNIFDLRDIEPLLIDLGSSLKEALPTALGTMLPEATKKDLRNPGAGFNSR